MTITDLLTTYWSQTTLFLVGVGYLIKQVIDSKNKKFETNYSLFQQNKINAIDHYYDCYANAEQMWNHLSVYEILDNKFTAKEIDEQIFPSLNAVRSADLKLKMYLDNNGVELVDTITSALFSVNGTLNKVFFAPDTELKRVHRVNEFTEKLDSVKNNNKKLINLLTKNVRSSFSIE